MKDRTTLTKSLHTITVVSKLADYLMSQTRGTDTLRSDQYTEACREALRVLGWTDESNWTRNDPTFAACVAKLKQIRSK